MTDYDRSTAKLFLRDNSTFMPIKRSILIIADSQCRFMDTISSRGLVISISGGKYQDMVNALDNGDFDPRDFLYVIVYCGTNVPVTWFYTEKQRQDEYRTLRSRLVWLARQKDRLSGTILFSCAFDHFKVKGNHHHASVIARDLENSPVRCLNWSEAGSPFHSENGRLVNGLFDERQFHLNHDGSKALWQGFCKAIPEMECFEVTYSKQPKSVPKETFMKATAREAGPSTADDANWQPSRKRRIVDRR